MISRYRDGRLRTAPVSAELAADVDRMRGSCRVAAGSRSTSPGALDAIWESVRTLNRHVEQSAPWELAKDDARGEELDRVLYELADGLRAVAVALAAFVPETSARILAALGQPGELAWDGVASGAWPRSRASSPPRRSSRGWTPTAAA